MRPSDTRAAFSLVELLVVVALLAVLAGITVRSIRPPAGAGLESGQALLVQLLDLTRLRAAAGTSRLLVHNDPAAPRAAERYLRRVLVQDSRAGIWRTVTAVSLPSGVRFVPGNFPTPAGLWGAETVPWVRGDGGPLRSTALRAAFAVVAAEDDGPLESWIALTVTPVGTTFSSGDLVLARARLRPAGAAATAPVVLTHPDEVRGVSVSAHAVALPIHERRAF